MHARRASPKKLFGRYGEAGFPDVDIRVRLARSTIRSTSHTSLLNLPFSKSPQGFVAEEDSTSECRHVERLGNMTITSLRRPEILLFDIKQHEMATESDSVSVVEFSWMAKRQRFFELMVRSENGRQARTFSALVALNARPSCRSSVRAQTLNLYLMWLGRTWHTSTLQRARNNNVGM